MRFLFAISALLGLAVALCAEPAPAPTTPTMHPRAAAALAIVFAQVKLPDPFVSPAKPACHCTGPEDCTCGTDCVCPNCVTQKKGPQIGDTKVTDDPSRPWTWGYGREFGYNELGWYRPLVTAPVVQPIRYFRPVMSPFGGGCSSGG